MSSIASAVPIPVIAGTAIRQDDAGRYSLNDLHRAAGGEDRHQPSYWLRLDQTSELCAEIDRSADLQNGQKLTNSVNAIRGGLDQGTYVAKELVYAYAMWISPAFCLRVIRTFDQLTAAPAQRPAPLPRPGQVESLAAAQEIGQLRDQLSQLQQQHGQLVQEQLELLKFKVAVLEHAKPTRRALTDAERRTIRELHAQGLGKGSIGQRIGRSKNTVESYLRSLRGKAGAA